VVGSANIDLTFRTPRLPVPGETLAGDDFHLGFGGKGANQAVMAARLGADVTFVGCVGHDPFGEQTLTHLRQEGIDTRHVRTSPDRPSGVAAIVVDARAQNCILLVPGANAALSPADVCAAGGAIGSAAVLLCQLEVPLDATHEALRLARAASVRTILNPAPALDLPDDTLRLADLCVPNEPELATLTGLPAGTLPEIETAARRLLARGPGAVLVTLGERGALLVHPQEVQHFPPVAVQAVDPTGAGDAFIGSLAVFLAEGRSLLDGVRAAGAVAALSVTRPGAQSAFPTRVVTDAFLTRQAGPEGES
jgi:ribokinase